jgi:tetratricopeptide (TPR) repeat protein
MQLLRRLARTLARAFGPADPAELAVKAFQLLQKGDRYRAARLLAPELKRPSPHADVLFVQGLLHKARAEHATAAPWFRKAAESREGFGAAWNELATALTACGHVEGAVEALARAAALQPRSAGILQNLGRMRYRARDVRGAIDTLEAALAIEPDLAEAHFNLAEALLATGDFERGWSEYEWRPQLAKLEHVALPRWNATGGGRVAVIAEQGLGDVILAVRLLPRLKPHASHVTVFVQPALVRLIQAARLADDVRSLSEIASVTAERYDAYLPMMSLARVTGLRADEIARAPYLHALREDVQTWRERAGAPDGSLRVGVVSAGNPSHDLDYDRSIPVSRFSALSEIPGVVLYSLQLDANAGAAPAFPMIDFTSSLSDLAHTAALVQQLDVVVAVDTAVAHLAGALGVPVWVLCPYRADWRWEIDGRASPWYGRARIFRPAATAQWDPVIAQVGAALTELAASRPD